MIDIIDILNWLILFVSAFIISLIFKDISKRIGEALQIKQYYKLYDASVIFMIVAMVLIFAEYAASVNNILIPGLEIFALLSKALFLLSLVMVVLVTIKYWGWIIPEVIKSYKK
jgi:hypothetical protein